MAEAPSSAAAQMDQLILDYLKTAATPKKAPEIAQGCSVTKQEANKVLYQMWKEGKVEKRNDQKWVVCADGKEMECHQKTVELNTADTALVPPQQHGSAVIPVTEDSRLTDKQEKIYKFLSENGPHNALAIAKHTGKETRKDVNADLYALQKKHILSLDENTKLWSLCGQGAGYKAGNPGPNKNLLSVVIQNNPTNYIYQGGVQNTVSIADSRATQIGNCNSLNLVDKKDDYRPTAPSFGAASENTSTLHCEAKAKATAMDGQEINITDSTLKNTVIGNDNQMNIVMKDFADSPGEHLDQDGTPEKNPFGDLPRTSPGLLLEIVSTPHGEGRAPLQRVSIDGTELNNVVIGNNNHMSVLKQGGSADLAAETTNEEDDGSDSSLTSEQSTRTSCDDSSLDGSHDISSLCEKFQEVIIGNNNYMNVEETADTGSDREHEEE
ncbi:Z-DNA-binding protein 1 [Emydura macquarii macquarii]|uniref:Z-DNA-binding protein 1 n=1 Tax=Emydura macquarii macquarii TaxID=1129001 RepID=UPI00352B3276